MLHRTILLAASLLSAFLYFMPVQQTKTMPPANAAYIKTSAGQIVRLDKFYSGVNSFFNFRSTITDVVAIHTDIQLLEKEMDAQLPPLDLLALHTQVEFASYRCENLAIDAERIKDLSKATALDYAPFVTERENCTTQIQAAKLRLLDYATPYGVNPFK